MLGALLVVIGFQLGDVGGCEERQTEAGGSASCWPARAAQEQGWMGLGDGTGAHCDSFAAIFKRFSRPCFQNRVYALGEKVASAFPFFAVKFVFAGAIAQAEDGHGSPAAHDVQNCQVFSHSDRVVQRQQQSRDRHGEVLRAGGDHGCVHHRRGAPSVLGPVMLLKGHPGEAVLVHERSHLQHRPIAFGHLVFAAAGNNHVESCHCHNHGSNLLA